MQTPPVIPTMAVLRPSLARRLTLVLSLFIGFGAIAYVVLIAVALAQGSPGYDFRYFWVAGRVWLEGVSPYAPDLSRLSAAMIPEGHVPKIWPYPPTLWLPTTVPALFAFDAAWKLWLGLHTLTMILASAVVAAGFPALRLPFGGGRDLVVPRPIFFALHLGLMAYAEANLLSMVSGQVTGLLYLGATVMLAGIYRERDMAAIAGLTILLMKPHIGAVVALGLLVSGARGRRIVGWAGAASVVLLLPALAGAPTAVLDWLHQLGRYDGANSANLPEAMTGLRNLMWHFGGVKISNLAASLGGLVVSGAVALWLCRRGADGEGGASLTDDELLTLRAAAMILVALSAAPLHLYDFLLVGAVLPLLPLRTPARMLVVLAAIVMLSRPTYIYLALSHAPTTVIFAGSTVGTLGAAILLIIALSAAPVSGLRRLMTV